jgi:DNA-binding FrmR family transcriptional regulator
VQNSLKSLDALLLENHLKTCVVRDVKKHGGEQSIKELLRLYRLVK